LLLNVCSVIQWIFSLLPVSSAFQIDELLEYAPVLSSGPAFENGCKYIDEYLEKRTFLVGYSLSIADVAIWAGLAGKNIV
jgi:glutamyl-tRNA synthetase